VGRACWAVDGAGRAPPADEVPEDCVGRLDGVPGRDAVPVDVGWGFQPWGVFFSQLPDRSCRYTLPWRSP
jgi:hypothetical protein